MEKSAAGTAKQFKRLLILFILFLFSSATALSGATVKEIMRNVQVSCNEDFCFTGKPVEFSFTVKNIEPRFIEYYIDKVPDSVDFIFSKKEAVGDSTVVTMSFKFAKTGRYKLNPLVCSVKGYTFYVPFKTVDVYENPDTIQPELAVDFVNTLYNNDNAEIKIHAGSHLIYTVCIRYAKQVIDINYDLPKDSVFTELKRFSVAEPDSIKSEFSTATEKLATFDWQPLVEGTTELPQLKVTAVSYNGSRCVLYLPERNVRILPPEDTAGKQKEKADFVFAYAFTESQNSSAEKNVPVMTDADVVKLAQLRLAERKSFPFSSARKERIAFENSFGLNNTSKEPCIPFFIIILVMSVVLLSAAVILFAKKKYLRALVALCASVVLFVFTAVLAYRLNVKTAVFAGSSLSPVPEENASVSINLEKGSCVTVTRQAGKWLYVKMDETYGWTTEDKVIFVR